MLHIRYVYDGVYTSGERAASSSFAQPGGVQLTGSKTRKEVSTERVVRGTLGGWDARANGLGGFTLDVHHAYDPASHTLFYGDGRQRSAETVPAIATLILPETVERAPAEPLALPDGSLLFASNNVIYRFSDGQITPFAGGGAPVDGLGDDGPALAAQLANPRILRAAPDGSVYFWSGRRIRRVDPGGQIHTVVGDNPDEILLDDGDVATDIQVVNPGGLAISSDGVLYFSETAASAVYAINAAGRLQHIAGGLSAVTTEPRPARDASTFLPAGLGFAPDGSLFITASSNNIWRIDSDGLIALVAGKGNAAASSTGDRGLARDATVDGPLDVAFDAAGNAFIAEYGGGRIRTIDAQGVIDTLASVPSPRRLSLGPDCSLYVGALGRVTGGAGIYKVSPSLPGAAVGDFLIAAEDGSEVYLFDPRGRHLATVDAHTGI
jgi:sugar lactone lactonase YvrE